MNSLSSLIFVALFCFSIDSGLSTQPCFKYPSDYFAVQSGFNCARASVIKTNNNVNANCFNVEEECALDLKGQVDFFNLGSGNFINSIAVLPDCALTIYDDVSFRGRAKALRGGAQDEDQLWIQPRLTIASYKCDCENGRVGTENEMRINSRPRRQASREARIILPKQTNGGESVQSDFEARLRREFGGFTRTEGQGSWNDENQLFYEGVWIYDIAVAGTPTNNAKLEQIATWLKGAAQQLAIYLRYPNGTTRIIGDDGVINQDQEVKSGGGDGEGVYSAPCSVDCDRSPREIQQCCRAHRYSTGHCTNGAAYCFGSKTEHPPAIKKKSGYNAACSVDCDRSAPEIRQCCRAHRFKEGFCNEGIAFCF